MKRSDRDVDEYLSSLEGQRGAEIRALDAAIGDRMAGHDRLLYEGKFWGGTDQTIVGYGILDHENRSGDRVEWFIVGLARQKSHVSIYVNAVVDGRYLLRDYEKRLGKAKVGSASVSFGTLADVDFDALMEMVERCTAAEIRNKPSSPTS